MSDEYLTNLMSQFLPTPVVTIIEKGAASCTYNASNYLARGFTHIISAAGDYALQMPEGFFNTAAEYVTGNNPNVAFYNNAVKPFVIENNPFTSINNVFTKALTSPTYELIQNQSVESLVSFQASDLIAPLMVSVWSSKKCAENTLKACFKIQLLLKGKSSIIEKRNLPTGCISGKCTTAIYTQENISIKNLLLDIVRAGGWFALSHYSTEGILNALTEVNPASAGNIVSAIRIASFGVPLLWTLGKNLANRQTPSITKDATPLVEITVVEQATSTPQLVNASTPETQNEASKASSNAFMVSDKLTQASKNKSKTDVSNPELTAVSTTQIVSSAITEELSAYSEISTVSDDLTQASKKKSNPELVVSTTLVANEASKTHAEISTVSTAKPANISVKLASHAPIDPSSSKAVGRVALIQQAV